MTAGAETVQSLPLVHFVVLKLQSKLYHCVSDLLSATYCQRSSNTGRAEPYYQMRDSREVLVPVYCELKIRVSGFRGAISCLRSLCLRGDTQRRNEFQIAQKVQYGN